MLYLLLVAVMSYGILGGSCLAIGPRKPFNNTHDFINLKAIKFDT